MKLQAIRQKQDEEKKKLIELRTLLRSTPDFDRVEVRKKLKISWKFPSIFNFRMSSLTKALLTVSISCKATRTTALLALVTCTRKAKGKFVVCGRNDVAVSLKTDSLTFATQTRRNRRHASIFWLVKSSQCPTTNAASISSATIVRITSKLKTRQTRRHGCRCWSTARRRRWPRASSMSRDITSRWVQVWWSCKRRSSATFKTCRATTNAVTAGHAMTSPGSASTSVSSFAFNAREFIAILAFIIQGFSRWHSTI